LLRLGRAGRAASVPPRGRWGFAKRRFLIVTLGSLFGAAMAGIALYMAMAPAPDFMATCLADDYAQLSGGLIYCEGALANERNMQRMASGLLSLIAFGLLLLALTVATALWDL
jgi:hypothetical protein